MLRRVLIAAIGGALACAAGPSWADGGISFRLADQAVLGQLSYGEFAPGTLDRGAIEEQTPAVRLPLDSLGLEIGVAGEGGCGADIAPDAALFKQDVVTPRQAGGSCLFLATLSVGTAAGPLRAIGDCDEWRGNISYCLIEGGTGQFWLRRAPGNQTALQLVHGPWPEGGKPPRLAADAPGIPERGIMLFSVVDDAGREVSDRWLLLPVGVVSIGLKR